MFLCTGPISCQKDGCFASFSALSDRCVLQLRSCPGDPWWGQVQAVTKLRPTVLSAKLVKATQVYKLGGHSNISDHNAIHTASTTP